MLNLGQNITSTLIGKPLRPVALTLLLFLAFGVRAIVDYNVCLLRQTDSDRLSIPDLSPLSSFFLLTPSFSPLIGVTQRRHKKLYSFSSKRIT